jgi:hypothetical protein
VETVFRNEAKGSGLRSKEDSTYLAEIIFQGEIDVLRGREPEIRNLSLNPHVRKSILKDILDLLSKFGDGQDVPKG